MTQKDPIHISFVLINPVFLWAVTSSMMQAEAARRGIDLNIVPVNTFEEQLAEIERQLSRGVDALMIKPIDSDERLRVLVERTIAAGVPVVTVDSTITGVKTCTVGSDSEQGQALVTTYIFELLRGRGKVAYFEGDQRLSIGRMRAQGFYNLLPQYPNIQMVYKSTLEWDKETPASVHERRISHMREALAQHPDLDAVVVATDIGALDVSGVIEEQGLTEKILVGGFDAIPEAFIAIRTGRMTATTRQSPRAIAAKALDTVARALKGESLPDHVYADVELVTHENADAFSLDTLQTVPGLICDLAEHYQRNRQLQQAVISTQQNILATVAAVSKAVSQIREQDQMMRKVVELLADRFDLDYAALYLNTGSHDDDMPDEYILALRAASGEALAAAQKSISQTDSALIAQCMTSRRPAAWRASEQSDNMAAAQRRPQVQAELVLPLTSGQELIGVLDLQSTSAAAFDADTRMVLQAIADQVAIAIDNARLYAETVSHAQEQAQNRERLILAEKMASLGRLTDGLAQEMNTPLATVRSSVLELETLVKEYREAIDDPEVDSTDHYEIADEMSKALSLAAICAEKTAGYVRSVQSQTRDVSTQQFVRFNVVSVIEEALVLLGHAISQAHCQVQFTSTADPIELFGSSPRLAQAVANLVNNAIDASTGKDGGPIALALSQTDTYVELKVADHGCGIPAEVVAKMYEPMFSTKPFGQSSGLGLTIVHDVVTSDFSGSIDVDTKLGEGSTFWYGC